MYSETACRGPVDARKAALLTKVHPKASRHETRMRSDVTWKEVITI